MTVCAELCGDPAGDWVGDHDGACDLAGCHTGQPAPLSEKLDEIEGCLGRALHWEIDPGCQRLRGWVA